MFDGFLSGVFGGLLGPAISKWLGKYVFWKVFTVVMLALYALLILIATKGRIPSGFNNSVRNNFHDSGLSCASGNIRCASVLRIPGFNGLEKKRVVARVVGCLGN